MNPGTRWVHIALPPDLRLGMDEGVESPWGSPQGSPCWSPCEVELGKVTTHPPTSPPPSHTTPSTRTTTRLISQQESNDPRCSSQLQKKAYVSLKNNFAPWWVESMDLEPSGMEGVTHSTKSCVRCLELTIRCSHMRVTGNLDPNSTVPWQEHKLNWSTVKRNRRHAPMSALDCSRESLLLKSNMLTLSTKSVNKYLLVLFLKNF